MANPPKKKGTAFETALVAHILDAGFPAIRVALKGAADQGDVWVTHDGTAHDYRAVDAIRVARPPAEVVARQERDR